MNLSQLIEILKRTGARKKFLTVIEEQYKQDQHLIPNHENEIMKGFVDHFENMLVNVENSQTELVNNLINSALTDGHVLTNTRDNKLIVCISVDCTESTNLVNLSREEIKKIFDKTVFRTHNIIRENMSNMLACGGRIILLNKYRGPYDVVSYTLEALAGTLYREIRDTDIHISLIDYHNADKNMLALRIYDCINSLNPKFHYCVGTDVYLSKLAAKILPENTISDIHQA